MNLHIAQVPKTSIQIPRQPLQLIFLRIGVAKHGVGVVLGSQKHDNRAAFLNPTGFDLAPIYGFWISSSPVHLLWIKNDGSLAISGFKLDQFIVARVWIEPNPDH
ncbi:MAG: hypothetical protein BRD48_03370 [Bacteroidetes bacterium QS_9_68_14]|nr:MAG: hypothetical protein BRD48_03370 [Bacteroidetes bacterium QS_9_68_14]